jgi:hypothetical protein
MVMVQALDAYQGNSDRFPGESRNNDRLPWSTTFDLGYNTKLRSLEIINYVPISNILNLNWL